MGTLPMTKECRGIWGTGECWPGPPLLQRGEAHRSISMCLRSWVSLGCLLAADTVNLARILPWQQHSDRHNGWAGAKPRPLSRSLCSLPFLLRREVEGIRVTYNTDVFILHGMNENSEQDQNRHGSDLNISSPVFFFRSLGWEKFCWILHAFYVGVLPILLWWQLMNPITLLNKCQVQFTNCVFLWMFGWES